MDRRMSGFPASGSSCILCGFPECQARAGPAPAHRETNHTPVPHPLEGVTMPVLVQCPDCKRQLRVQDALLNKRVKCPQCGSAFLAQVVEEGKKKGPPLPL